MRTDITFSSDGVTLRGWLYRPEGRSGKRPAIVMAHGFSATKEMYLDDFAEVFVAAGFAVMVYDHRNFGDSDGEPRGEIDPVAQVRGYRDAITWLQDQPGVDRHRIGAWGTSYSGGHVIQLGAIDRRVKCVVSQVPAIDGYRASRAMMRGDLGTAMRAQFDADRIARFKGAAPAMIPVVPDQPMGPGALSTADSVAFFKSTTRIGKWRNEVTLRSIEYMTEYSPGLFVGRISPTPFMLVVALRDVLATSDLALEAYERALQPKRLLALDCGHFDPYTGDMFKVNSAAQSDWFVEHLRP
ncbi:MAG TPA: alpha/beta hydrolase [Rhizomicrobium sp.]|nr:alpha/beta hydrolase [Rhizomicrobium sp.]